MSLHECSILDDATIKCWATDLDKYDQGYSYGLEEDYGQLGLTNVTLIKALRNGEPIRMDHSLPTVDLGTNRTAKALALGEAHSCALLGDDSVRCWGRNHVGQLGTGEMFDRDRPTDMGDNLGAVDLGEGETARAIAAGFAHTCAILSRDSSVKCWGDNKHGQLGIGDNLSRGNVKGEMGDFLPTVNLGTGRSAVSITAGDGFTCAILDDGSVKCWGYNNRGQLGIGDTADRGDDANEMGDNLPAVDIGVARTTKAVSAGPCHMCALLDDSFIKCWGDDPALLRQGYVIRNQVITIACVLGGLVVLIWVVWTRLDGTQFEARAPQQGRARLSRSQHDSRDGAEYEGNSGRVQVYRECKRLEDGQGGRGNRRSRGAAGDRVEACLLHPNHRNGKGNYR